MAGTLTAVRTIPEDPLATDHFLALAVRIRGVDYSVEVPRAGVRFVLQDRFDPVIVPPLPPRGGQDAALFEVARDRDKPIVAARKHFEDRSDDRRLFLVDGECRRGRRSLLHVVVADDAVAITAHPSAALGDGHTVSHTVWPGCMSLHF
jgi:hypothetical protein